MASADATTAARDSATRLGSPVEPEVAICNGSGDSSANQCVRSVATSAADPATGRRLGTGAITAASDRAGGAVALGGPVALGATARLATPLLLETTQEVGVVVRPLDPGRALRTAGTVGADRASAGPALSAHPATLQPPERQVDQSRERDDDQQELAHASSVGGVTSAGDGGLSPGLGRDPMTDYAGRVKPFAVYTLLRLALFVGCYSLIIAVYMLVNGVTHVPRFWPLLVAVVLSSLLSYPLLRGPR